MNTTPGNSSPSLLLSAVSLDLKEVLYKGVPEAQMY